MFIAALLTMGNIWKPPECPAIDEWMKMWYIIHSGILAIKKNLLWFQCDSMNGPRGYYAKWNKSERKMKCDFNLYVESKKQQMKKGKQ